MRAPVKTLLWGLTDTRQAREAGLLGIDGAVVPYGAAAPVSSGPPVGAAERAPEIAAALPPLAARWALVAEPLPAPPPGFHGIVVEAAALGASGFEPLAASFDLAEGRLAPAPPPTFTRVVRGTTSALTDERLFGADAAWVVPADGIESSTAFDYAALERIARRTRLVLEVPDGATGVEAAIRLARPYAVLFGSAVWYGPGIVDFEQLERALAVVARLNKGAFER